MKSFLTAREDYPIPIARVSFFTVSTCVRINSSRPFNRFSSNSMDAVCAAILIFALSSCSANVLMYLIYTIGGAKARRFGRKLKIFDAPHQSSWVLYVQCVL